MSEEDLVGQTLAGRYRIEERLGSGGMGAVYRAIHVKVGRQFAVKVLHPDLVDDPKQLRRFEREAELAGALRHPNVIGVIDVGETPAGSRYLVMEHAPGEPLSLIIARGPLDRDQAVRLLLQLCDGLFHAHSKGVVHRDLKPDNIIVEHRPDGDMPRIVDFGVAILTEEASVERRERLTTEGIVLGTPHYMAPEQAFGGAFDHRVDLFALGIISYEMLTGRLPFDGSGVDVARSNMSAATPPMGIRVPFLDVDPLLEAFTRRLMKKNAADRPATAEVARKWLELIASDRGAAADALGLDIDLVLRLSDRDPVRTVESQPVARVTLETGEVHPVNRPVSVPNQSPPRTRRGLVIGVTAGAIIAIAAVIMFATRDAPRDPQIAAVPVDAAVSVDAAAVTVDAAVAAAIDAAPIEIDAESADAAVAPVDAAVHRDAGISRPPPDARVQPVEPSARVVADLYVAVGKELRALSDRDATRATELWSRYRLIRINDAMANLANQRAALAELASIRAAIPNKRR